MTVHRARTTDRAHTLPGLVVYAPAKTENNDTALRMVGVNDM